MKKFKYPLSSDTWNKKEELAIKKVVKSKTKDEEKDNIEAASDSNEAEN